MRHAIGWLIAVPAVVIGATVLARVDGVSNTAAREASVFVPLPASAFQTAPRQQAADSSRVRALLQAARGTTLPLQISRDGRVETIEVKIPAGVKDGSRVRIKGRGQQVSGAGEAGDLYIVTRVQPHPYFRRDGLDVLVDLPVSAYEAMLGTKVEVPTLEGPVTLTVPPGASSGAKLRVKGRGIQRGEEKGDQFVVTLRVPAMFRSEPAEETQTAADKPPEPPE